MSRIVLEEPSDELETAWIVEPLRVRRQRFEKMFAHSSELGSFASADSRRVISSAFDHDGRWRAVRNGIRQYGDAIAAAAGDKDRVLAQEEFRRCVLAWFSAGAVSRTRR